MQRVSKITFYIGSYHQAIGMQSGLVWTNAPPDGVELWVLYLCLS